MSPKPFPTKNELMSAGKHRAVLKPPSRPPKYLRCVREPPAGREGEARRAMRASKRASSAVRAMEMPVSEPTGQPARMKCVWVKEVEAGKRCWRVERESSSSSRGSRGDRRGGRSGR
eukprot:3692642-Prymnesium_polylepis.1